MATILDTKRSAEMALLDIPGVMGIGIDWPDQRIRVYVEKYNIRIEERVPDCMSGYPVDIIETGTFSASFLRDIFLPEPFRRIKWRPAYGGISAGHSMTTAGTLGACAIDEIDGGVVALSNNHVFARESTYANPTANVGDIIVQPSLYDGGSPIDGFAALRRWVPLDEHNENLVDCAIARPISPDSLSPHVIGGKCHDGSLKGIAIQGMAPVSGGEAVHKFGRTTGHSSGTVIDADFTTKIQYSSAGTIVFVDQILASMRVEGGDSGSILLDDEGRAVGLVIASAQSDGVYYAIANKIRNVASMIGVSFPEAEDVYIPDFDIMTAPIDTVSRIPSLLWVASGIGVGAVIFQSARRKKRD